MDILIRELRDADEEPANELLGLAFHNPVNRLKDLRLYRRLQPDGWFGAFLDGRLIGTVGEINYSLFAHIGFMTVHPDLQGQGIGRKLMQHVLDKLDRQQVPLVTLDASKAGHYLYPKIGFVDCEETITLERRKISRLPARSSLVQPITVQELDEIVQFDQPIFGANRRTLFQTMREFYPGRAFLQRDTNGRLTGYIFAHLNRIGPWGMLQPDHADELLMAVLELPYEGTASVCVPAECPNAMDLLRRFGFEPVRSGRHMKRGAGDLPGDRSKVFAQTSLGAG